jgi:tetratricopeptide (TPR) repeat protein
LGRESTVHAILARAQTNRLVLQDYCPLAESLEWQLGQLYWQERGSQAFLADAEPVPYVVNNDGTLSRSAAEVLFASLASAERSSSLPATLYVLELGIGVGLFARFFLDAFLDLCQRSGANYYERICYVACDRSSAMLSDAARHGLFERHPGHYLLRVVDACQPEDALLADAALDQQAPRPFCAVFLNYILDCLPATVLEVTDTEVRQLCVRTCLARGVTLDDGFGLNARELARCAESSYPDDRKSLLGIYDQLSSEYAYRPVDIGQVSYGDVAQRLGQGSGCRVLHNYGAIRALERLLGLVRADGFILVNDYGLTEASASEELEHQRFSRATSIGLNFPLLKTYFADGGRCQWEEPLHPDAAIHSRLMGSSLAPETRARFHECFSKAAFERQEEALRQARGWAQAGRLETALACYGRALEQQPANWVLLWEVATFLVYSLGDGRNAVEVARIGLGLNPLSTDLWDTLGDGQLHCGRLAEARESYARALQLNNDDVRARIGLARIHAQERDYSTALCRIGEGLALDLTGHYREHLLQQQSQILERLAWRNERERLRQANRISTSAPTYTPPTGPIISPESSRSPDYGVRRAHCSAAIWHKLPSPG